MKKSRIKDRSSIGPESYAKPVITSQPRKVISPSARTKNQKRYIKAIERYDIVICEGPAGTGKAGSLDSLVYTVEGPRRMGDIVVGDMVCTPDGNYAKVLSIHPQGKIDIYKVIFTDGSSTECSKDHLWYTYTSLDRGACKGKGREGSVKTLKEIMRSLMYKDKRNHSIPMTEPVFFTEKSIEIDPYLLGALLGDGALSQKSITFSSADREIIDKIDNKLGHTYTIKKIKSGKYDYIISKYDKHKKGKFYDLLDNIGVAGKKSNNKFIPNKYKYNSVKNRIELLRGLMDTDGTVSKNGYHVSFTSISKQLALDVQFLVESLGGTAKIKDRKTTYTYNNIKKKGQRSYTVSIVMPNNINPFSLKRKADLLQKRTRYKSRRYIDRVEYIGKKKAQCIYIDHPDHLYLTDNFLVTHNTHLAVGMALNFFQRGMVDKIVIARPTVEAGEKLGFMPGGIDEKMNPFVRPAFDELENFITYNEIRELQNDRKLEIVPIAFMRGRTFKDSFIVCDECQNLTFSQMKMLLTRTGTKSRLVLTGDIAQSDLSHYQRGAFQFTYHLFEKEEEAGTITLTEEDIQRHSIVSKIVKNWDSELDRFRNPPKIEGVGYKPLDPNTVF